MGFHRTFLAFVMATVPCADVALSRSSALPGIQPDDQDAAKSELRVLFVGHDPAAPKVPFPDLAVARTYELYRERTAAFEQFLREYFADVRVVHAADYTLDLSDGVDVTVFDSRPRALPVDPAAAAEAERTGSYLAPRYLPQSFSRPALMIAENSPRIGESIGLKLDWL